VKLATRLNWFFLATLALVLAGFSGALYYLARVHLHQQTEERLEAALNTLAASVNVEADGVEWERSQRQLKVGPAALGDQAAWLVTDDQGKVVDGSAQPGTEQFLAQLVKTLQSTPGVSQRMDWQGESWQCHQRRIEPDESPAPAKADEDEIKYPALTITAALSLQPVSATLRSLAGMLWVLSVGIWLLVAVVGHRVCRRGLLPVTRMAVAAGEMRGDDLGNRLPTLTSGDELEDLSRAFNQLLDRLQESFERQRRFTGDASHQLRTPLAAILGQIEVALRRQRSTEEYQQVLSTVQQKAGHLQRIVESLLFLARADNEAEIAGMEPLDLNDWLPRHVQTWSQHPRAPDLILEVADGVSATFPAQPALLAELINILIDNACHYSRPNTQITVRLDAKDEDWCLHVEDHGSGISSADLAQVFAPFFRSEEARRQGVNGIGLGLAIAQRLAQALGGRLTVVSNVGKGSCFTVRLPRYQAHARATPPPSFCSN
jgi:heavy metal sensor kinase